MTETITPVLLDLNKLTQEQLDRAMEKPGSCRYSGPCIIGAMLPQEMVDKIVSDQMDTWPVRDMDDYIIHMDADEYERATAVQKAFDSLTSANKDTITTSRAILRQLLPHLDHSKY